MPYDKLPTLLLQILLIGYSPGPANIYALAMSLRYGRKKVLVMWLGLLTGFSIAVCTMAILTHTVGMAFGKYVPLLKYFGAYYIAYLAYKIYNNRRSLTNSDKNCDFFSGMIVQMTNAKMLLFELTAFSTLVLPYSNRMEDLFEVGAWLLLAGPGANLVWLLTGSYLRHFFTQYDRRVDTISALGLLLCAVYIIL